MSWTCPYDGAVNTGDQCDACGNFPFTQVPILVAGPITIGVNGIERIIGALDWPAGKERSSLSKAHIRIFFNTHDGHWYVSNISRTRQVWVDGWSLAASHRYPLAHGSVLKIGSVEGNIKMRNV